MRFDCRADRIPPSLDPLVSLRPKPGRNELEEPLDARDGGAMAVTATVKTCSYARGLATLKLRAVAHVRPSTIGRGVPCEGIARSIDMPIPMSLR